MLDPLPLLGLGLLAADELGNPDRRRHLGGEAFEQLAVVGRVGLVGETAAQVEHPDELALADERDHQFDPSFAQLRHRRGVEVEPLQLDRRTRRLQIGSSGSFGAISTWIDAAGAVSISCGSDSAAERPLRIRDRTTMLPFFYPALVTASLRMTRPMPLGTRNIKPENRLVIYRQMEPRS